MSQLEKDIETMQEQLRVLAARARDEAVAEEFLSGTDTWRVGDYFTFRGSDTPGLITNIASDGKFTLLYGNTCYEPYSNPTDSMDRLYTTAQVLAMIDDAFLDGLDAAPETEYYVDAKDLLRKWKKTRGRT